MSSATATWAELWRREIAKQEVAYVPNVGTVLLPGAEGFHPTPTVWYVNPSYMPPSLLQYFVRLDPMSPWSEVLDTLPAVARSLGGFAMDWVTAASDGPGIQPSASPATLINLPVGQSGPAPVGSYDAIRVYLWAGIADPKTPQVKQLRSSLSGMDSYLKSNDMPPLQVDAAGKVLSASSPPGFSAAVIPYLQALGLKTEANQQSARLSATLKNGLYGTEGRYYDQNLALFQTGWSEGRYRFDANGQLHLKWK